MSKQNTKSGSIGGGFLFTIAVILLASGYAMESSGYDVELGSLLFTIGFWLMMIPIVIISIIIAIFVFALIVTNR